MMGRSHLVAHTALAGGGLVLLGSLASLRGTWTGLAGWAQDSVISASAWTWEQLFPHGLAWWWVAGALVLFYLGSLLPDVDNKSSILGRYFPRGWLGPHRGISHTDWLLAGLLLVSVPQVSRIMIFCWLGAVLHAELDAWSVAGRARFWPLGAHKTISQGNPPQPCVVVKTPRRPAYRTGQVSEYVTLSVCVVIGAGAAALGMAL